MKLVQALPLIAVLACLADGGPARAANTLDDATVKVFGGTYAVDCRKAAGPRLIVAADTLAVELGAKQVTSHDVQRALTFGGQPRPADYRGTLLGDVPGGEPLVFQAYRDAHGPYLLVEADTRLLETFGKAALAPKFRSCGAAGAKPAAPRGSKAGKPAGPPG